MADLTIPALTVQALRRLLSNVPDHARVGVFIDDDAQGHSVMAGQGYNVGENIFWLQATSQDDEAPVGHP